MQVLLSGIIIIIQILYVHPRCWFAVLEMRREAELQYVVNVSCTVDSESLLILDML